jgi:hypothetical protein
LPACGSTARVDVMVADRIACLPSNAECWHEAVRIEAPTPASLCLPKGGRKPGCARPMERNLTHQNQTLRWESGFRHCGQMPSRLVVSDPYQSARHFWPARQETWLYVLSPNRESPRLEKLRARGGSPERLGRRLSLLRLLEHWLPGCNDDPAEAHSSAGDAARRPYVDGPRWTKFASHL